MNAEEFYDDEETAYRDCPKCQRHYDDVDYDFQSCSKCGWDEENKVYGKSIAPTMRDFESGDADILTGRWN